MQNVPERRKRNRAARDRGGIRDRETRAQFQWYARFFPSLHFPIAVDNATRRWRRSYGATGDLKYGHVDAKNIDARYLRFIRCIADPARTQLT